MSQDDLRFQIDQVRKDKIIYAVEATATVMTCVLCMLFAYLYMDRTTGMSVSILALIVGIGYMVYMGVGNYRRLKKVQELERQLHDRV